MPYAEPIICHHCIRFLGFQDSFMTAGKCTAFREFAIPVEILEGKLNHVTPIKGDNGLMFLAAEGISLEDVDEAAYEVREPSPLPTSIPIGEYDDDNESNQDPG